ncbi:FeoB-associated Cys-rich membrane protein [Faecalicatena contorta]|uniref:Virus attachment protein p12 family protein n=1 Tax=Faecalicatena contorta TaxID=39482 RepID=A0A315ZQC0_9FIRM|nr:FeoB-associated Cys-rich membrane protein [Faecalicatena contorta]PWJ47771.1 attachment p12 family protein [Faecalicatena contorta]SUQ15765.1 Virus attachment protein p12 family protein [Faecalicatena contorta]
MGTILVGAILAGAVAMIIRGMIRDKKNGKSVHCGSDCKNCGGHCGH